MLDGSALDGVQVYLPVDKTVHIGYRRLLSASWTIVYEKSVWKRKGKLTGIGGFDVAQQERWRRDGAALVGDDGDATARRIVGKNLELPKGH